LPDLQTQFADLYGPQGLQVLAIDPDPDDYLAPDSVAAFASAQGVQYPVMVEETATTPTYTTLEGVYEGANAYPIDLILDRDGIIRYISREYDPAGMDQVVQTLLAE
jgi:peroxiredoxin